VTPAAPSPWVCRFAGRVPRPAGGGGDADGRVLDLACGQGRHGRLFRARGHPATLLDRDTDGVADLAADPDVEIVEADLEDGSAFPVSGRRFAGVVVTNYLHRPLLPALVDAVAVGGVLIYETFAAGQAAYGRPSNPAFLLDAGELLAAVRGTLTVVAYEDTLVHRPDPARVQRICAVRA
jgi:SAM-dependent methyltransferase